MAAMSDYLENLVLDACLGKADTYAAGALDKPDVWLGLFTVGPSDAGGGTEVTIGADNYARRQVPNETGDANWVDAVGGLKKNAAAFAFGTASGSWGTITHVGIFDAASAGNLLFHGPLNTAKTVGSSDTFSFGIGDLQITLT